MYFYLHLYYRLLICKIQYIKLLIFCDLRISATE
nr:MAG TPA: hypothetical protein [Caudoviricetes sp.]